MPSFTNSRNVGNTIRARHEAGLQRLRAAQIELQREALPKYNARGDLLPVGATIDGQHYPVLLTRHQIADALGMHPQAVWRWTQHPAFPAPIHADLEDLPTPRTVGRQPQYWDVDSVTAWALRYAPQKRRYRHAYNWWLLEMQHGTWTAANGYAATARTEARRAAYEKKCADWIAKGLDPYGDMPPAELLRLNAVLDGVRA